MSDTIAWTYELINYINVTYLEYSDGKFGDKKAWHVTTKLASALILEVSKPRENTFNELETDNENKSFNARVVFYNTLQALDIMLEISSVNFGDHPSVSTELVKFLSLNTAVDAVDKLALESSTMKGTLETVVQDVAGNTKSLSTLSNKHDALLSQVKDLTKQVKKTCGMRYWVGQIG